MMTGPDSFNVDDREQTALAVSREHLEVAVP